MERGEGACVNKESRGDNKVTQLKDRADRCPSSLRLPYAKSERITVRLLWQPPRVDIDCPPSVGTEAFDFVDHEYKW